MGINSQGTAYDFGQMGSMLVTGTDVFYPPKNMVIVAITSLDSLTDFADTVGLVSELNQSGIGKISVSNFVTTAAAGGHVDGEATDADPFIVKSVATDHFIVTKDHANNDAVATAASKANGSNEACFFYSEHGQGVGGIQATASNMQIPAGVTIYGRWTSGKLAAGSVIAYFGH